MSNPFQKAVREQIKLRLLITGPTGGGKSYTALTIASVFGKVAALDTENRSLSRYANRFDFDVLPAVPPYNPRQVVDAIKLAAQHGYDALIIDSLYHFWKEEGGVLDIVEKAGKKYGGNQYAGWSDGDKAYREMMQAILHSPVHLVCTMRSKMAHEQVDAGQGKKKVVKLGLHTTFRDGAEYEFDAQLDMTEDHCAIVTKTRFEEIDGQIWEKPGRDKGELFLRLVTDGAVPTPPPDPREHQRPAYITRILEMAADCELIEAQGVPLTAESLAAASMDTLASIGQQLKSAFLRPLRGRRQQRGINERTYYDEQHLP